MDIQTHQIKLRSGVHTYCDVGDSKHTILLLHGFSFRQGLYPLVAALKPIFRVVVPDLPFSTRNHFRLDHTLENYTETLLEFVQKLGLEEISIFGNSVGGTLGMMCCMRNPQQFEWLLVRSPLWSRAQLPAYLRIRPLIKFFSHLSKNRSIALKIIDIFYRTSTRMSPVQDVAMAKRADRVRNMGHYGEDYINPIVLTRFMGHLVQVEIGDQLHTLQNTTLILWGERDNFVTSKWGAKLDQILPDSQFLVMPGEYHNIVTSDTATLAEVIEGFIT